jgi:hypothetical protein
LRVFLVGDPPTTAGTPNRDGVRGFLLNSTNWAILCCFGIILTGLPIVLEFRYPGLPPWVAAPLACLFVAIVLLLATSFIEPPPLWRAFIVVVAGGDVIGLTWAYLDEWRARLPSETLGYFVLATLFLAIVLTFIGTYQLREVLRRLYYHSGRPSPPPAGNSRT